METEIWKDIPGYEGKYKISNMGNIYSYKINRELKKQIHRDGYYRIRLSGKAWLVHRLVAIVFISNNITEVVMHIDNDPKNNKINNLKWGTQNENLLQCKNEGRFNFQKNHPDKGKFGIKNRKSKKILQFSKDGFLIKEWYGGYEINRSLGFSQASINNCCLLKTKTAYGYKWKYEEI